MKIAAFDIGGTALKMGVMTRDGRLLETAKQSINDSDGDQILQAMLSWLAAHPSCEGIAISAPGYVDPHSGFITMGGAIRRFDNFAMKSWLEREPGCRSRWKTTPTVCCWPSAGRAKRRRWPIFWCSLSAPASVGRFFANTS
jgi:predicted NBD/HSP70 family sugar kinase